MHTAECFLSFSLAEETFLASPPPGRCHTEGPVGHLQPRPARPRRLRSAADMLTFISPSSRLRAYCCRWAGRARWRSFALLPLQDAAGCGRAFTHPERCNQSSCRNFINFLSRGAARGGRQALPAKKIWTRRCFTWPRGLRREGPSADPTSVSFLFIILSPAKCTRSRSLLWKLVVFLMMEQTSQNALFCRTRLTSLKASVSVSASQRRSQNANIAPVLLGISTNPCVHEGTLRFGAPSDDTNLRRVVLCMQLSPAHLAGINVQR